MEPNKRKHERHASDVRLYVYDAKTGHLIGKLANLSAQGAMLVTSEAIKSSTVYSCRMELPQEILGHRFIEFTAECRWSRKNVELDRWESGYQLSLSGINAEMIEYLILGFKLCGWADPGLEGLQTVELESRRRSVRYEFDKPLPVFEKSNYRQIGVMADLSVEGMRLLTQKPIEQDQLIECRVKLPKPIFQQEYLILEAVCMWCRKGTRTAEHASGFRLVNVSRENAAIVLHLIIHYARPQSTKPRVQVIG